MYYEINIAKLVKVDSRSSSYKHFFATAKRSITTEFELNEVLKHLVVAFPKPEFCISIAQYEERGLIIDPETILNKYNETT